MCCCGALAAVVAACATATGAARGRETLTSADSVAAARAAEAAVRERFFGALARFDYAGLRGAVTPSFELEEDSLRLSADQFASLLLGFEGKAAIAYRLDSFATQVASATGSRLVAWTSYRNHGTFTPAGGQAMPLEWLESAVLVRDGTGIWRVDRLHSTPIHASR